VVLLYLQYFTFGINTTPRKDAIEARKVLEIIITKKNK
jgi:hypothetical protein